MTTLPQAVRIAAYLFATNALWGVLAFVVYPNALALVLPVAVLQLAAPLFSVGLLKVSRGWFIGTLLHVIATAAIGGATLMFMKGAWLFLGPIVTGLGVLAVLLGRERRTPFLRQRKTFRKYVRRDANLKAVVELAGGERVPAETIDISRGGTYVAVACAGFSKDQRVKVDIELRTNKKLRLPARVISVNPDGQGNKPAGLALEFTTVSKYDVNALDEFVSGGRHLERIPVTLPVKFELEGDQPISAETLDVSLNGCYIRGPYTQAHPGDKITLSLTLHEGDELDLIGEVMWMSMSDSQGKPPGVAVRFLSVTRHDKQRLYDRLKEAGVPD